MSVLPDQDPAMRRGVGPLVTVSQEGNRPLRLQVFERIRAAGLIPRVQLARDLSISPASVTAFTHELIAAQLIEEVSAMREVESLGRGRPAVALGVKSDAHLVAGIKLSEREMTAVVMDFAGTILADAALPRQPGALELPELLAAIETLLQQVCAKACIAPQRLSGLGLGVPGFVDMAGGLVLWSSVLRTPQVALAAALEARLGLPVTLDNDANLVALAELWFGAGRGLSNFAVVSIEHGVGMGLVMGHRVYRGAQGLGVELGHTKVQLDGALCRCGQRGCLEAYVADYALAREASTALNWGHRDTRPVVAMLESLYQHAKAGDALAHSIFRRAGRYLALGLSNVVNLFDPELIILSGERMQYDYLYAAETLAEMQSMVIRSGRPLPPIEVHAWGDLLWAQGAGALALSVLTEHLLGPGGADLSAR